jgi:hypothetical protein
MFEESIDSVTEAVLSELHHFQLPASSKSASLIKCPVRQADNFDRQKGPTLLLAGGYIGPIPEFSNSGIVCMILPVHEAVSIIK